MGPKKDPKKEVPKREQGSLIDEPLNTDFWRCVVVMAVERNTSDCFVVREFMKEFSNGRRREVGLIDFESFLMKLLNDFANGNLQYKYASLLKFSSVLQEASEYVGNNSEIPVPVLAKVVKIILFHLKEESMIRIEKAAAGPPNPITAMMERPANLGVVADPKKKDTTKKKEDAPKVRPPSITKEDTKLLKRGECVKSDQCINDAPLNGYFNLYVLLTGFYFPDLPLELIKTGVPLHGLICIDTSQSGVREESTRAHRKPQTNSEEREGIIRNFWDVFLKILWNPIKCPSFKDTIFQVYIPRSMRCDKDKLREFIFRELSFLMYDMSDFKRQLNNYLTHMKLWNVEETSTDRRFISGLEDIPNECATVPVVLQYIIDAICTDECDDRLKTSANSKESLEGSDLSETSSNTNPNWYGNCLVQQKWSRVLNSRGDFELLKIYNKTKELDAVYNIFYKNSFNRDMATPHSEKDESQLCNFEFPKCGENMKEALSTEGTLQSYWKKYTYREGGEFKMDFCLFPIIMTGVFCPYLANHPQEKSDSFFKKSSNFEIIENLGSEMRKPHFTVTDSSRSILKSIPYNVKETSRDFFNPTEFKIVTPEKLKASSAPQFRVTPKLKIQKFTTSELFSREISKSVFENLRELLGESFSSDVNGFDFLELLGKSQLIETSNTWDRYNCIDHTYSLVNDCIFVVLHNRMDGKNVHHETFNEILKTGVGLRDFYDYVLDDESDWFKCEEEIYKRQFMKEKSFHNLLSTVYSDSDFWMVDSIKYKHVNKAERDIQKLNNLISKKNGSRRKSRYKYLSQSPIYDFEGYDVSNIAVQFSGLKTVYYSNDSCVIVELIERLYGNQDLGIHVTAAGHALHLYSYVCPEPHILNPFTFHITYNNGTIVAFQRRFVEKFEEVEEILESKTLIKGKRNSSELSTRVVKKLISKTVQDEEFSYDMVATLPNGLSVRTVRKMVEPCYIKQKFLSRSVDNNGEEISRLFLPNGNVVKMKNDNNFEIFKPDTAIIKASFDDLHQNESGNVGLEKYHIISSEGYSSTFENEQMSSPVRLQILQNADLDGDQIFFRRRDGTNYLLLSDGTLCMEFKDGTKISSALIVKENGPMNFESGNNAPEVNSQKFSEEENSQKISEEENSQKISEEENSQESSSEENSQNSSMEERSRRISTEEKSRENSRETEPEMDFVFVYTKITMEHPDYATVVYDSSIEKWIIHLPQDSIITVDSKGQYTVEIDNRTDVRVEGNVIQMNRCTIDGKLDCTTTADLSVFENTDGNVYCHMEDSNRKIFIVEVNSNCYILEEDKSSIITDVDEVSSDNSPSQQSVLSEFVASADLQSTPTVPTEKYTKLSQNSRYFVVMRDITGFELLHTDNVEKLLSHKQSGSLIFTENVPDTDIRIFVLLTPETVKNRKKWQVSSIIPNPVYVSNTKPKLTSSTYGIPPSWSHPFPKRKNKFKPPEQISCRVFIETKKTELSPPVGVTDCYFCEVDEIPQPPIIPQYGIEEYFQKLKHNDQDLLKQLYTIVAESLINEKKKLKPDNSEKVEHYLQLSRYYVDLEDYHKKCIRYHTVPNYFHHPAGMSWLILNGLVNRLNLQEEKSKSEVPVIETDGNVTASSKSTSPYSYEEIEYDLSVRSGSYTDLSYRSDLSAQTAPPVLRTGGVSRCNLSGMKDIASSPVVKCYGEEKVNESLEQIPIRECDFKENDLAILEKSQHEAPLKTLEDLICLGLI